MWLLFPFLEASKDISFRCHRDLGLCLGWGVLTPGPFSGILCSAQLPAPESGFRCEAPRFFLRRAEQQAWRTAGSWRDSLLALTWLCKDLSVPQFLPP